MGRISTTNVDADSIGDVAENLNSTSNRSGSVNIATQDTYADRSPRVNGATTSRVQQPAGSTRNYGDFKSTFKVLGGNTSYTTGAGKSSVLHSITGWATAGGMQGATNSASSTQIGQLYDGQSTFTTSAKSLAQLGSFDSNKFLSAIVVDSFQVGFSTQQDVYICFEGGGAQTGDTDWTRLDFKLDGVSQLSDFIDYRNTGAGGTHLRTDAFSVSTVANRIVYKYVNVTFSGVSRHFFASGVTAGYTNFYSLV
tara:strand:+ start:341 stop:1099 length:759 start_codon:yes stop_codon:yes gene_type:complete